MRDLRDAESHHELITVEFDTDSDVQQSRVGIHRAEPETEMIGIGSGGIFSPERFANVRQIFRFQSVGRVANLQHDRIAAGLALLPLVLHGDKPGHKIEHPLAVVILGGLVTSTAPNLFLMPALYAVFGRVNKAAF